MGVKSPVNCDVCIVETLVRMHTHTDCVLLQLRPIHNCSSLWSLHSMTRAMLSSAPAATSPHCSWMTACLGASHPIWLGLGNNSQKHPAQTKQNRDSMTTHCDKSSTRKKEEQTKHESKAAGSRGVWAWQPRHVQVRATSEASATLQLFAVERFGLLVPFLGLSDVLLGSVRART